MFEASLCSTIGWFESCMNVCRLKYTEQKWKRYTCTCINKNAIRLDFRLRCILLFKDWAVPNSKSYSLLEVGQTRMDYKCDRIHFSVVQFLTQISPELASGNPRRKIITQFHYTKKYYGQKAIVKWKGIITNEPQHEFSNNVKCSTSIASDQPMHTWSLIRAFASSLNILWLLSYCTNIIRSL